MKEELESAAMEFNELCRDLRRRIANVEQMLGQINLSVENYWVRLPDNVHELRVFDGTNGYSIVKGKVGATVYETLKGLENHELIEAAPVFAKLTALILRDIREKTKKMYDILSTIELGATPVATHDG